MKNNQSKLFPVGKYTEKFNNILKQSLTDTNIYQSKGLEVHISKRHPNCVSYIDKIPEIISNPDYIGVNKNESSPSFELIKIFDKNILVGIKLDINNNRLYVSTLHDIKQSKIDKRLFSGRLKRLSNDIDK